MVICYCYCWNKLKISEAATCYCIGIVTMSPSVLDGLSDIYSDCILLQSGHLSKENMQVSLYYHVLGCP